MPLASKTSGAEEMAVLLEEVVLGLEDVLEAELVGELDLLQGLLEDLVLLVFVPLLAVDRPQRLQLVKHAEFHATSPVAA